MARTVFCQVLKAESAGLETPPYPGDLGQRIYENISNEGWNKWLQRLTIIINENRLSTADPRNIEVIEQHMLGFLFDEGNQDQMPQGFVPAGGKK